MNDLYVLQGEPCPICSEYPHNLPSCLHCSGTGVRANSGPITLAAALMILEREKNRTPCHNCGSRQYEWYHRDKDRAHCSECTEDAAMLEEQEKPKIDLTTLRENYYVVLESHPDKPDTRVPCSKCGHTEFMKIGGYGDGLHCSKCGAALHHATSLHYTAQLDRVYVQRDKARQASSDYERRWHGVREQRDAAIQECDEAIRERDQARQARDINASHRDEARRKRDEVRANCVSLRETVAKLSSELDARPSKLPCLNCSSMDYVWYFDNGESAYCSKCSPDTPPPPKPLLKFLACPGCNRMLGTLSEHLPPGRCCLCGTELSPPVCPHCGNDTFHQTVPSNFITFKADGTLALPSLYFFQCARCGKEVGTLPLKRADK